MKISLQYFRSDVMSDFTARDRIHLILNNMQNLLLSLFVSQSRHVNVHGGDLCHVSVLHYANDHDHLYHGCDHVTHPRHENVHVPLHRVGR